MAGKNLFTAVKAVRPNRSVHDLTHDVKMSFNMGLLYPTLCMPTVPTDRISLSTEAMIRMQPLVAPVMHRLTVYHHYWKVPYRLLWQNYGKWITGFDDDGNKLDPLPIKPYIMVDAAMWDTYPLLDYFGIPRPDPLLAPVKINALPFIAYQLVYKEFYRDQNLTDWGGFSFPVSDGDKTSAVGFLLPLRNRAWEHDYFTSALPWAQKGDPVNFPMGNVLFPVKANMNSYTLGEINWQAGDAPATTGKTLLVQGTDLTDRGATQEGGLYADGQNAENGPLITDVRRSFRLQEYKERLAVAGTRLSEFIYAMFGRKTSDARLQRPEYIGGSSTPIIISEIANTTGQTDGLPQGNLAGHGMGVQQGGYCNAYTEEQCYIIGVMSVLPKTAYQQGVPKEFLKFDPLDEYNPFFERIGEQAILNEEVYINTATRGGTFGYVPRYAEYKFMNNRTCGDMRDSLSHWTFTRRFDNEPALNDTFIKCVPTLDPFAVQDGTDVLIGHILHKIKANRPMSFLSTPSI